MYVQQKVKVALVVSAVCVAIYLCVDAVKVNDEDSVRFLKDGVDETRQTFQTAAAEMDKCREPVVNGKAKVEWPELIGTPAAEAKAILETEAPGFNIQTIGHDMMATMDWRCDRIRIWLDAAGNVAQAPRIG